MAASQAARDRHARGRAGAKRTGIASAALMALAMLAAACGNAGNAATGGGTTGGTSDPGVTANSVRLGLVTSLTGPAASSFGNSVIDGANARIAMQNAAGGVNGRKIQLVSADDASSPQQVLTATQTLVENEKAFAVLDASGVFFGAYRYTAAQRIPVLGIGIDGPEWGDPSNDNLFSDQGSFDGHYPGFSQYGPFLKKYSGTRLGVVAYGDSPSSSKSEKGIVNAVEKSGIEVPVVDFSPAFGDTNFSTLALKMKQAGVNAVSMAMVTASNLALLTALKQDGVQLRTAIITSGYTQDVIATPAARQAAEGNTFLSWFAPAELQTPATKTFQAALRTYAHYTAPNPTQGIVYGWMTADLAIKGLEVAGKNFTQASYIKALRGVHDYDGGGLINPIDFSRWGSYDTNAAGDCWWATKVVQGQFRMLSGKPFCGTAVPGTNAA